MKTVNRKAIKKYALLFVAMLVCSNAKIFNLYPFATGLLYALVYHRFNPVFLGVFFIVGNTVFRFSWQTLVASIAVAAVPIIAKFFHRLFRKPLRHYALAFYCALSQIPAFFLYGTNPTTVVAELITIVLSIAFFYCCAIFGYALFVRGMRYKTTVKESLSGGILLCVLAIGLFGISFSEIRIFYLIYGFALVAIALSGDRVTVFGSIVALAVFLCNGDTAVALVILSSALVAYALKRLGIVAVCVGSVALKLIFALAFGEFSDLLWINSLFFAVGALIFALLPENLKNRFALYSGTSKGYADRTIVNRNRLDMYTKLTSVEKVLKDMEKTLLDSMVSMPPAKENKNYLAKEVAGRLCGECPRRSSCESELGTTTASAVYDLVDSAITRGRATIVDVPPFFAGRCPQVPTLLNLCGEIASRYDTEKEMSDMLDSSRLMMSEQVSGIAGVLSALAADVKKIVSFEKDLEQRVSEGLAEVGIIVGEIIIYSDNRELFNVIVIVGERDADKKEVREVLSRVLGCAVVQSSKTTYTAGMYSLNFVTAPEYDMLLGKATTFKEGSEASGDTKSMAKLSPEKLMLAICDGMGSGRDAMLGSTCALNLVESFYKAGIEDTVVLSLINKLLSLRNVDNFQALDMSVINLRTGAVDFVKMGAPQSLIRRKEGFEIIEGAALPMGILDNVRPSVSRKILSDGDMLVLVSDGITEAVGIEGVARMVEQNKTSNPQILAELILADAREVSAKDDMTVLCGRLYRIV